MKRVEAESVGDVLRRAIEEENLTEKLLETRACALWPRVVGQYIAARSSKPAMRRGIMTVAVSAASLRNDLDMSRSSIIKIINSTLGRDVVRDIRFIS